MSDDPRTRTLRRAHVLAEITAHPELLDSVLDTIDKYYEPSDEPFVPVPADLPLVIAEPFQIDARITENGQVRLLAVPFDRSMRAALLQMSSQAARAISGVLARLADEAERR